MLRNTMNSNEFEQRMKECRRAVTAYAYTMCGDFAQAEDIVQDACVIAFQKQDKYISDADFCSWLIAIARNLCLREFKKRKIRNTARKYLEDNAALLFCPEDYTEDRWLREKAALNTCMGKLQPDDQMLIRDHFLGKMKYDAIADKFHRTLAWVKVRMHRCRLALRECVEKTVYQLPDGVS
ncbi:MAG: sigma-70 family RNA polymerase sigma factor [Magnetococcus sp. WYHC-3]